MDVPVRRRTRLKAKPRLKAKRRLAGITEAAEYADVSARTVRRYVSDGRLTGFRVGPRLVKIDLDELDRIIRPIPAGGGGDA
jgi:excisionase family DNA binding protein